MDTLAFRLVWPMRRLTESAVLQHMRRDTERLSPFNAKLIQRYGLLDGVDHDAMLSLLTAKARRPPTPLDFAGLRQTLQAVQRFPIGHRAAKKEFEAALLSSVLATPPDHLSSAEYAALWAFAAQITEWEDVARLAESFPLRQTLHMQSDREFRAAAELMLVVTDVGTEGSRGARMLREIVGEAAALQRAVACVSRDSLPHADNDCSNSSGSGSGSSAGHSSSSVGGDIHSEREAAVGTLVGVAAALRRWPSDIIPDESAWARCGAARPTSLHVVDLHYILRVLTRAESPAVPEFARAAIREALSADLWRCYTELPPEPVAVFFTALNDPLAIARLRAAHETAAARHMRHVKNRLPLARDALVSVFIGSVFLGVAAPLTAAIAAALQKALAAQNSPPLTPLEASAIAVALERLARADHEKDHHHHNNNNNSINNNKDDSNIGSGEARESAEAIGRRVEPSLRYEALREQGCGRCVARLLSDCPAWTRQWGLEEGCHKVLREHAGDGFTQTQLQRLLNGADLPEDVREIVAQRITETPAR